MLQAQSWTTASHPWRGAYSRWARMAGFKPPWMDMFLAELMDSGGNVFLSADLAGVTRKHVYATRGMNVEFRSRWNLTLAEIARRRIPRRKRPRVP